MAAVRHTFADWHSLTNEVMTNLFLYGILTTPEDLNERVRDDERDVTVLNTANIMDRGTLTFSDTLV